MRATASERSTTCLPLVWPQRLGASWSSIITHAKPARAKPWTVRRTFIALPQPVSASPMTGMATASQMLRP